MSRFCLKESFVTSETDYYRRRDFMRLGAVNALALGTASAGMLGLSSSVTASPASPDFIRKAKAAKKTIVADDKLNDFDDITQYNNFYELGTSKTDPYKNASALITDPWSVSVEGLCAKPGKLTLEDLLKPHDFEERIYRLRCVEAWSMVIPWMGFPLADLLKRFEPSTDAKYVAFETLYDKGRPLPGQRGRSIRWPYREGLRMDEAMNPLTFMAVGLYGKVLPNQNGAPLRLVVPWKYGFKSIKSIVKIKFVSEQPETSWNQLQSREYGFYSNVNPAVNHPRWSQARERRIGELRKRRTLMFNGYEKEVAGLYKGMDLQRYF